MKTIFYNFLFLIFFLIFIFLILSFYNYKYSGNPIYHRLGIETKHLKYFKKNEYNSVEKEYLNYFSKYNTREYLEIYKKENKINNLYSSGGEDVNMIFFLDKNNCRENQPNDYLDTDIVLLGDSYLWGVSINKPFDIAGRLRDYFPEKKILNLGTPGSGPSDQIRRLINITEKNNFKNLVWFFYEGNDYEETKITGSSHIKKRCGFIGNKIDHNFNLINDFTEDYSFFIRFKIFLAEFLRGFNSFLKLFKDYTKHYNLNENEYDLILREATRYLNTKNVDKRIIFYIPSYSYQSHKRNSNHPQIKKIIKLKKKVKEISLKNNFQFIDGNIFLNKIEDRLQLYHFGYPTHYNSIGYKFIAEQLYDNLEKK